MLAWEPSTQNFDIVAHVWVKSVMIERRNIEVERVE